MAKGFPWSIEPGRQDMESVNCVLKVTETVEEGNEQRTAVVCLGRGCLFYYKDHFVGCVQNKLLLWMGKLASVEEETNWAIRNDNLDCRRRLGGNKCVRWRAHFKLRLLGSADGYGMGCKGKRGIEVTHVLQLWQLVEGLTVAKGEAAFLCCRSGKTAPPIPSLSKGSSDTSSHQQAFDECL